MPTKKATHADDTDDETTEAAPAVDFGDVTPERQAAIEAAQAAVADAGAADDAPDAPSPTGDLTDEDLARGWSNGPTWNGLPTYRCVFCPRDALEQETIEDHVRAEHVATLRQTTPLTVPLFDQHGNMIRERRA